jgi:hypothetical protein
MSIQSLALKLPWHRPLIVEDIMLSPPAAQLSLSPTTWRYMVLNRDEKKAELNKARVDSYRERQVDIMEDGEKKPHPRACCTVAYDATILDMLVAMGQILDAETDDTKEVGKAISEMLAEAAQDWKAKH